MTIFYSDEEPLSQYSPITLHLSPATRILNENPDSVCSCIEYFCIEHRNNIKLSSSYFTREHEKLAEDLKEQMEELKLREEEVRTVTHAHTHCSAFLLSGSISLACMSGMCLGILMTNLHNRHFLGKKGKCEVNKVHHHHRMGEGVCLACRGTHRSPCECLPSPE